MMKLRPITVVIVAFSFTLLLLPSGAAAQTYLVDTGPGVNVLPAPSLFNTVNTDGHFQFLAGQFTLASGAVVDSVEGWMGPCFCIGGSLEVRIRADASGLPGNSIFSKTYNLPNAAGPSGGGGAHWAVFSGYNVILAAGTYWLSFEPPAGSTLHYSMPPGVANPLAKYAYFADGNNRWISPLFISAAIPNAQLGMRIAGTSFDDVAHGTAARTLYRDTFTPQVERIGGGNGQLLTVRNSSHMGAAIALGRIIEGGLEAGAYARGHLEPSTIVSDARSATGAGRGAAFRTFVNDSDTALTFKVNAVLTGQFDASWCCTSTSYMNITAGVYAFKSSEFRDTVNASGMDISQFLLGGDSLTIDQGCFGGCGGESRTSLASLFPAAALLGSRTILVDPHFPTPSIVLPPDGTGTTPVFGQPVRFSLETPLITVGPHEMFTMLFDVSAVAFGDGNGRVDFISTLSPAANFFTYAGGNPVTGILELGSPVPTPATAMALNLTPASNTSPVGGIHTVTATATDATGAPVPDAIVNFTVTAGPNAGLNSAGVTDANGQATFTCTDLGGAGTDSIQAGIGTLLSNEVLQTWQAVQSATCPQHQGFWKNNPEAWPVSSLTLGSQTYAQAELLQILGSPGGGDASRILAVQLIAAKLNVANGSDPAPISDTILDADGLLSGFSGKLPYNVKTSAAAGSAMTQAGRALESYNKRELTPACVP